MKKIIRYIKKLFGVYESGYEYYINLSDIKVPLEFYSTPPRFQKMSKKWKYYMDTGKLESKIIVDRNFNLVDGYTSYIIAKKECISKVPVIFID